MWGGSVSMVIFEDTMCTSFLLKTREMTISAKIGLSDMLSLAWFKLRKCFATMYCMTTFRRVENGMIMHNYA